jgi:hypothetical protein
MQPSCLPVALDALLKTGVVKLPLVFKDAFERAVLGARREKAVFIRQMHGLPISN